MAGKAHACGALGAGSGIGAAGAMELARRGAIPELLDCDADTLEATAALIGRDTLVQRCDVTDAAACEAAVAAVLSRHGRLDAVWANAGIASFGPLAHTDPQAWQRVIDVNVMGVFNTVRAALPAILRQSTVIERKQSMRARIKIVKIGKCSKRGICAKLLLAVKE